MVRRGRYVRSNAPPHLTAADGVPHLERLLVVPRALSDFLSDAARSSFDVIALYGLPESRPDHLRLADVARALAPGGVALISSVLDRPAELLASFAAVGLASAERCVCPPGAFCSHWLLRRSS